MNPSTPPPDPMTRTQCFLCGSDMYIADAQNHSGHYAHGSCIARQTADGNPSLPEDYRPVPRREEPATPGLRAAGGSKLLKARMTNPESKTVMEYFDDVPPGGPPHRCRALYSVGEKELRCNEFEGHSSPHCASDTCGGLHTWHTPPETLPQGSRITEPDPPPVEDPLLPSLVIGQDVNPATEFDAETKAMVAFIFPKELVEDGPNAVDILREIQLIAELLLTKNRAYGSSFAVPLGIWSKLSPVDAINARLDDKLARIKQAKDFSEDTELDVIGYLVLKRIALKLAAREKKGLIKDMQWHCLYQSPVGLQCQLPAGHEGPHQILTDTEQTKLDAKLGTQPQRVAFVDPAFSSADKAVMGMAEITPQGVVSVQHPGPTALQQKIARVLDKLEETASKANMPKAEYPPRCGSSPPENWGPMSKGSKCVKEKGHTGDCAQGFFQWPNPASEGHKDEPTNSPFIPTSEDYRQMFPPPKGHQDEPGPARPADRDVTAPAAPAAGSSPPADSSTVEGHAPAPPVFPYSGHRVDVQSGL